MEVLRRKISKLILLMKKETKYCYVFVRLDIPVADQLCQVGHACLDAGRAFKPKSGTHIVVIGVKNKDKLMRVSDVLIINMIKHKCFYEPDDDMGFTAIATEAIEGRERRCLAKYKLWEGA